jgi:Ca2+-binding EF-hand superfamily protein
MSDFWVRKIKTYFQLFDYDKDGVITQKDFEGIAHGFVEFGKLDETKAKEFASQLNKLWTKFMEGHQGEALTEDMLIATLKKQKADPDHVQRQVAPLTVAFNAIDTNADGIVQVEEYEAFFQILGRDKSTAPATFKAIDTNNDGAISLDEFVTAGVDFFISEDENSPSKLFWGPLV